MPYWRLYYHFVWATKNRLPLITAEFEASLHNAIAARAQDSGALVHAIGGMEDHIHMAVTVPPKLALSRFIGQIKGGSAHFINHTIKSEPHFYWQNEYGVRTFGEQDLPRITRYINNQREHHAQGSLSERLERII